MEYEIRPQGKIEVSREGLYTVFKARVPPSDALLRLYARGENKTLALGLIPPEGSFRKKLTKIESQGLPEKISEFFTLRFDEAPEKKSLKRSPEEKERPGEKRVWQRLPDGSMRLEKDGFTYLALPAKLKKAQKGIRLLRWEGREYMVFRY